MDLTVVVPTYNRCERLRSCLEALSNQTLALSLFEVIVVVDGSTDGTGRMLAALKPPYLLRVLSTSNQGPGAARNHGWQAAQGAYCVFLDDDMIADRGLLVAHLHIQKQSRRILGLGRIHIELPAGASMALRCFAQSWSEGYQELEEGRRAPGWSDCYSGNLSLSRAALEELGGFAVDLPRCEDVELGFRLQQRGYLPVYIPEAGARQDERKSLRDLLSDSEKAGGAAVELYRRHPATVSDLLGDFNRASRRSVILRRTLLMLKVPVSQLAFAGQMILKRAPRKSYSFLHAYAYWRGVRKASPDQRFWRSLTRGVPILMYHAIGEANERASRYVLPLRRFKRQMALLKWLGYRVISLETFLQYRMAHRLLPPRSLVITIDDGYVDSWTRAYPVLQYYGFPATIFLVAHRLSDCNRWDQEGELKGRMILSWAEVRQMQLGGVEFGAHTRTHPHLPDLPIRRMREEITGSRRDLERGLGRAIPVFAYPYGEVDQTVLNEVQGAGFTAACGVGGRENGLKTPLHLLARTEVYGTDSLLQFVMGLRLGKERPRLRWRKWFSGSLAARCRRIESGG